MKLSVNKDDPGYRSDARLHTVTLDGKRVTDFIFANDTAGVVVTNKRDGKGKLVFIDGDYVTVIQGGIVTITLPELEPATEIAEVPFE